MFARSRKDSDRYLINGINRSVKKYMCDEKYPKELRFSMPFICDGHGIAWIPGMRERDGLHPTDPTHEKLVHIYVFKNKKV
jgi:tRNA(Ile)-lysidine synthetase-like protein